MPPRRSTATVTPPAPAWRRPPDLELTPILSNALDAFFEMGFHGTTVRDIARRVGITVPALYYHHENKEAILVALLDRSITQLRQLCDEALADAGDDPVRRFLNLVECLVLYMAHSTKMAYIDHEFHVLSPEHRKSYTDKRRAIERLLHDAIRDGGAAGHFDVSAPTETARALLGMIQAVATWFKPGGRHTARAVAMRYLDIAAHTVGATPAVLAQVRALA
ncbi:TetR/AcrR family transcriptional regulator [Dactylosporangium sp. NPDC048998]|uniref:TetR/AcrR family transcriptional regulator n=1 Tax=Dactylosporangium sp. NPDC048998 TaxID=3363976 RepID=UPI003713F659